MKTLHTAAKEVQPETGNRGEIMVEAMIAVVFTVFVLFMLLEMSFFLYQQVNIIVTANDTATRIAQTYRFPDSDYLIGFVSPEDVTSVSPYRYFAGASQSVFKDVAAEKCRRLAQYRLAHTGMLAMKGQSQTTTKVVSDALGRRHIEVTVRAEFDVPLLSILRFFMPASKISSTGTYTMAATARAECPDLIDYISTINYAKQMMGLNIGSETVKLINQILKSFTSTNKAAAKVMGS